MWLLGLSKQCIVSTQASHINLRSVRLGQHVWLVGNGNYSLELTLTIRKDHDAIGCIVCQANRMFLVRDQAHFYMCAYVDIAQVRRFAVAHRLVTCD